MVGSPPGAWRLTRLTVAFACYTPDARRRICRSLCPSDVCCRPRYSRFSPSAPRRCTECVGKCSSVVRLVRELYCTNRAPVAPSYRWMRCG